MSRHEQKRRWCRSLAAMAALMVVAAVPADLDGAELALAWDFPTHYADGTPLDALAGCRVYYGTASGQYSHVVDITNGLNRCTLAGLDEIATQFIAVTAYDEGSRESAYSDELVWSAGPPTPGSLSLDAIPDQVVHLDDSLEFAVTPTYVGDGSLTVAMTNGPLTADFVEYGDGTGLFTWTPISVDDIGEHTVSFIASDGELSVTGSVNISVASVTLTAPTAVSVYRPGDPLTIGWTGAWPLGSVNVELWQGSNLISVLTNGMAAPQATMTWETTVPLSVAPSDDYWVYIEDADTPTDCSLSELFLMLPQCAYDYDGDGKADVAVFRAVDGKIRWRASSTGQASMSTKGHRTWTPAVADYDGDGKADPAWYVAKQRLWRILESSRGYAERLPRPVLGAPNDTPVPADYDGDGKADVAVFRAADGRIRWRASSTGQASMSTKGHRTWTPAVADYDGDGKADPAWYVAKQRLWRILESSRGYAERLPRDTLGATLDTPVTSPLLPW